jgi:hypothetical protein
MLDNSQIWSTIKRLSCVLAGEINWVEDGEKAGIGIDSSDKLDSLVRVGRGILACPRLPGVSH